MRPYSPRQFPLPDTTYQDMLANMPDSYQPCLEQPSIIEEDVNDSSTLSPMSPLVFEGDDPDDVEWDPTSEKSERRKSALKWIKNEFIWFCMNFYCIQMWVFCVQFSMQPLQL